MMIEKWLLILWEKKKSERYASKRIDSFTDTVGCSK